MEDPKPMNNNDNDPNNDSIKNQSFEQVGVMFDSERSSVTMEKELNEFRSMDGNEKEELNSKIEEKIGLDIDDLGEEEESSFDEFENDDTVEQLEDEEVEEDLEDYFSSAEFIIWVIELVIVWGTNRYLVQKNLDKIAIADFKKTNYEQKFLVKTWAEVLRKYKFKVSPELKLVMAMGSAYVMKIKNIVAEQELRKQKSDFEKEKEAFKKRQKKKTVPKDQQIYEAPIDITPKKDGTEKIEENSNDNNNNNKKKGKVTKDNFRLSGKVEEAKEEEIEETSDLIEG